MTKIITGLLRNIPGIGNKSSANVFKKYSRITAEESYDVSGKLSFEKIPVSQIQIPVIQIQIPVEQPAFYDLGFDPNFSVDGNFYEKPLIDKEQPSFSFFQLFIQMVRNTIKYFASFLQTPEMKAFKELVQIEKIWHESALAKGMLQAVDEDRLSKLTPEDLLNLTPQDFSKMGLEDLSKISWQNRAPYVCRLREYQFFKQLSKIINPKGSEFYANDLLRPLHAFNRPQAPSSQSKEQILNGECLCNTDVARLENWGFALLGNHKEASINHKEFLMAIDGPGHKLKLAVRDLRSAIRKEDYVVFNEKLQKIIDCWKTYANSHQLLKDLSAVYTQGDHFKEMYDAYEKEYQMKQKTQLSADDQESFINECMEIGDKITKATQGSSESFLKKYQKINLFKELANDS